MALWDKEGIPHKGWVCVEMVDLGEGLEDLDAEERKGYYETCEMCSQEGVRFVHVMEHPEYDGQLRVGYKCAEKMENDYINPKSRETNLKNKHSRRKNFLKRDWTHRSNGNFTMKYKGLNITIMPSRYKSGEYGVIFNNKYNWIYNGKKIKSFDEARLIAFELFDSFIVTQKSESRYVDFYYDEFDD